MENTLTFREASAPASSSPFLLLVSDKGGPRANCILQQPVSLSLIPLSNFHEIAKANLVSQTQEVIMQQLGMLPESQLKPESSGLMLNISACNETSSTTSCITSSSLVPLHYATQGSQSTVVSKKAELECAKSGVKFSCDYSNCGKIFNSLNEVLSHKSTHKGLMCTHDGCGRVFTWPAHFKYHQLTHSGTRNYPCTVSDCDKTFYTAQRLQVHMRTHSGHKPFKCPEEQCQKRFTTAGNLRNHQRIHTGEKPFVCTVEGCGRRFAEYSSLKKHKLTHTGEKPYKCEVCGKVFSQSSSCKVHMKSHLAEKSEIESMNLDSQLHSDPKNNVVVEVLLQPSEESVEEYGDYDISESVIFSQSDTNQVITITTEPAREGHMSVIQEAQSLLSRVEQESVKENEDGDEDTNKDKSIMGGNVVVLSQPQEMDNITSYYGNTDTINREEVVYTSDLMQTELDHEEIAHGIPGSEISIQTIGEDDLNNENTLSHTSESVQDMGIQMDPIMELDEDTDVS
ncbi:hypothetical protein ACJMK2_036988 [Sinanodonta woodiana]|uniref:C2H2-type domain-containing protein n=1 Tax=Sinanodonta woodiana TaxID=1069815 RepID=A0ABD3WN28_SINWO